MKKFTPTKAMIEAANNVFLAMAYTETIRPIVMKYQQTEIDIMQAVNRYDGSIITTPDNAYAMNDVDFEIYHNAIKERRNKSGLKVEHDDFCPLLVAEELQRKAERKLCDEMYCISKLNTDDVLSSTDGIKNYKELIRLNLGLLAPYCKKQLAA